MIKLSSLLAGLCCGVVASSLAAADHTVHTFKKQQLSNRFWCEGANFGDFNKDGNMDIVSGPFWWEGPGFQRFHEYYPATKSFTLKKEDGKWKVAFDKSSLMGPNMDKINEATDEINNMKDSMPSIDSIMNSEMMDSLNKMNP